MIEDAEVRDIGRDVLKRARSLAESGSRPGIEVGRDAIGQLGLTGGLVHECQELERHLADVPVVACLAQHLEGTLVGRTPKQTMAVDEVQQRYRLASRSAWITWRVVDDVAALALRR